MCLYLMGADACLGQWCLEDAGRTLAYAEVSVMLANRFFVCWVGVDGSFLFRLTTDATAVSRWTWQFQDELGTVRVAKFDTSF